MSDLNELVSSGSAHEQKDLQRTRGWITVMIGLDGTRMSNWNQSLVVMVQDLPWLGKKIGPGIAQH